jgi:hypothetical protein
MATFIDSRSVERARPSSLIAALAVGLTLVFGGCSNGSSVEDSADAFEYTLPAGWKDEGGRAGEVSLQFALDPAAVRSIAAVESTSPFASMFVVVTPPGLGDLSLEQFARTSVREVRRAYAERADAVASGTPSVAVAGPSLPGRLTRTEVGGVAGMEFDYASATSNGSAGKVRNVAVVHDGGPYLLRFVSVTADADIDADREAFDEILDSRRWE